jgi:hypothetical protein
VSRKLIAGGKAIKRSQLRAAWRADIAVKVGFGDTDQRTGKIIKRPPPLRSKP